MSDKIIIRKVKSTEKLIKQIEAYNTLVFEVSTKETKPLIKKEIEELFSVKVEKVRTYIKDNKKFAYVKLKKEYPAIDIATKLGLM